MRLAGQTCEAKPKFSPQILNCCWLLRPASQSRIGSLSIVTFAPLRTWEFPSAVVYNKIDLEGSDSDLDAVLQDYQRAGYQTVCCSALTGDGISQLDELIRGNAAIIVGQSGLASRASLMRCLTTSNNAPQRYPKNRARADTPPSTP